MRIQDFTNMTKFEEIMANWAKATGLATVAVGADGKYISECYNFTDFCIGLTRGSAEGKKRCEKCDAEGNGVYYCHAGLIDFGIDLVVNGEKLGSVIGGQVLPGKPDEDKFRQVARELGIDENTYIRALNKVSVKTEQEIKASAILLGEALNNFINAEYNSKYNGQLIDKLQKGVNRCEALVTNIVENTKNMNSIQKRQEILALNARIEAARAGEAGKGFTVVAQQVGTLAKDSKELNQKIEEDITQISEIVQSMME
ncbi:MAG: PocR ligand-binding domain-containing protein [Lachnospiraceae bacterium]|nr:PocR ligand-binding domain-containing protein [Lachnospiraceae bacterium]